MHWANHSLHTDRQTSKAHCFGGYNRIKVIKAFKSAWIVGFKVVNDSFLDYADWVVRLPASKHDKFDL